MKFFAAFATLALRKPLPIRVPRRRAALQAAQQAVQAEAATVDDADTTTAACGWFDSSWALHAGLHITEHASMDRVVNDLPLGWWLAWQAGAQATAQRGGVTATAASAAR